ncbi:unnamed protein product, partial [Staurois parvus]
ALLVPPFTAAAVNHRVPASDCSPVLCDYRGSPTGRRTVLLTSLAVFPSVARGRISIPRM